MKEKTVEWFRTTRQQYTEMFENGLQEIYSYLNGDVMIRIEKRDGRSTRYHFDADGFTVAYNNIEELEVAVFEWCESEGYFDDEDAYSYYGDMDVTIQSYK